jgi:5-bromo-4-chloroindolyl phosphate hydrolysis protein
MAKKVVDEIKGVLKKRKKAASKADLAFCGVTDKDINFILDKLDETNKRIDRIVAAIDKSRTVRGL